MILHHPNVCKLGKQAPKHDKRDLLLADYINLKALPPPKPFVDWSEAVSREKKTWGMMGNDKWGDCTCAAVGHGVLTFTANTSNQPFKASTAQVLRLYETVTGQEGGRFNPVTGANDNGAMIADVLKEWRKNGFCGHMLGAYVSINPNRLDMLKVAIDLFGAVDLGLAMPISAQSQAVWDVTGPLTGDNKPGSWGGHSVIAVAHDSKKGQYCLITWGMKKPATEKWMATYMDEAWALLSPDWCNAGKQAPSGLNLAQLQADIKAV